MVKPKEKERKDLLYIYIIYYQMSGEKFEPEPELELGPVNL